MFGIRLFGKYRHSSLYKKRNPVFKKISLGDTTLYKSPRTGYSMTQDWKHGFEFMGKAENRYRQKLKKRGRYFKSSSPYF